MAILRFGPFELDTRSGELRRGGARVRIRPQPAAVLACLAERSGAFVSREELRRQIWGDRTFVHFDQGLNSCIKQVRHALGDHRGAPIYLETLPRRGYRFLAPVNVAPEPPSAPASAPAPFPQHFVTALARAVARELDTLVTVRATGSPEVAIRCLESDCLQQIALRAVRATLSAPEPPSTKPDARERPC
jgi:DNA-binding winged helix-turn-helix (wHTH) protein